MSTQTENQGKIWTQKSAEVASMMGRELIVERAGGTVVVVGVLKEVGVYEDSSVEMGIKEQYKEELTRIGAWKSVDIVG